MQSDPDVILLILSIVQLLLLVLPFGHVVLITQSNLYVKLNDMVAAHASYFAWKEDPNALHDPVVVNTEAASLPLLGDDSILGWHPKKLVNWFKEFTNMEK